MFISLGSAISFQKTQLFHFNLAFRRHTERLLSSSPSTNKNLQKLDFPFKFCVVVGHVSCMSLAGMALITVAFFMINKQDCV